MPMHIILVQTTLGTDFVRCLKYFGDRTTDWISTADYPDDAIFFRHREPDINKYVVCAELQRVDANEISHKYQRSER
jgi:hypothetical protein